MCENATHYIGSIVPVWMFECSFSRSLWSLIFVESHWTTWMKVPIRGTYHYNGALKPLPSRCYVEDFLFRMVAVLVFRRFIIKRLRKHLDVQLNIIVVNKKCFNDACKHIKNLSLIVGLYWSNSLCSKFISDSTFRRKIQLCHPTGRIAERSKFAENEHAEEWTFTLRHRTKFGLAY